MRSVSSRLLSLAHQIVFFPDHDMDPVVIDHEMTHVKLVKNSSLGLFERILNFFILRAQEENEPHAEQLAKSFVDVIMRVTEPSRRDCLVWHGIADPRL